MLIGRANGVLFERANKTENYVEIPPALIITDIDGACFTVGMTYVMHDGQFEWTVLRNDVDTGEFAKRIVYEGGVVSIYGHYGRKRFSHQHRCFI